MRRPFPPTVGRSALRGGAPILVALLVAACATVPVESTPRAEAGDPAELDLVGVVTAEGDTVRFDRPRAGDAPSRVMVMPRVEGGEVVAQVAGRPFRMPTSEVSTWLHRQPTNSRNLMIAAGAGIAAAAAALAYILTGGLD